MFKKMMFVTMLVLMVAVGSGLACSGWDCSEETGQVYVNGNTGFAAQSGNGNVFVASDNNFAAGSYGEGDRYVHGSSYADGYGFAFDDYDFGFLFSEADSYGYAGVYSNADAGAHGYKGKKWASADVSGLAYQQNAATANAFDFEGATIAGGGNWSQAQYDGSRYRSSRYYSPHVYTSGDAYVWGHTEVESFDLGPIAGADTHTHSGGSAWLNAYGTTNVQGGGQVGHSALADNNEWGGVPGNFAFTGATANYSFDNTGFCGYISGEGQANTSGSAMTFSNFNSVNATANTQANASVNSGGYDD